jgi:tetratricopeptide (TPR) repeat protein
MGWDAISNAYFGLNKYEEAAEAYENGLKLDPANVTLKNSLASAKSKMAGNSSVERAAEPTPAAGGMPNFGGGAGGMPDLGSLLNNPALMNMAQQMMQSGALDGLMNNPNVARM